MVSVSLGLLVLTGAGCTSSQPKVTKAAPVGSDAVTFNPLSKIEPGMPMLAAVRAVGAPDGQKGNTYYYKRRGRIVFAGTGTPTDTTKVTGVELDELEDGIP